MGNKTVKRLAILIGVIALLGGGGYLLWGFQVERLAHGVVARAEEARKAGNYTRAEELYKQHLHVVPGDIEVQLKYADTLLQGEKSLRRQEEALAIFGDIVRQFPARADVRRRSAELAFEMGRFAPARADLAILLKASEEDGHLEYLMARCLEQDNEAEQAEEQYKAAIAHEAPERFEAAERRAMLLRGKLGREKEAEDVIAAMIKSGKDDYRAYLARGRYREGTMDAPRRALRATAGAALGFACSGIGDFFTALELAPPDRPEVYLEVARAVEREAGPDAARQVLDKGLAAAPRSSDMYRELASIEQRAGRIDRAIDALDLGLKTLPEDINLRGQMAMLLAGRGESEVGRLLLQISELERLHASRPFTQYLSAYYHFNKRDFKKAEQILTPLQPEVSRAAPLKQAINLLLARCYAEMGATDRQQDAMQRAMRDIPNDLTARLAMIQTLIGRGDIEGVIREYRDLHSRDPERARMPLATYLLERNRRMPRGQRNWREVERLVAEAKEASPGSIDPAMLHARLLLEQAAEQDPEAKAASEARVYDVAETIRAKYPKDPRPWLLQAELRMRQGNLDAARDLLDRARDQVGDGVELRLAGMQLATARPAPQAIAALNELGRGLESFSREDRRRLLTALADDLVRLKDSKGAAAVLAQLARDEPQNLQPQLRLFELALQSGDAKQAEEQLGEIERRDRDSGHLSRAAYLAWKARGATDPAARQKARDEARGLLTELRTQHPDQVKIPLALARLDEEESADAGAARDARGPEKLESAIALYRQAIQIGQRDPALVRHYIQLLFRAGRGGEALDFYNQMPSIGQYAGDLGRAVADFAVANRDYQQAEEIAKKAVADNPGDFQARVWLSQVLMGERKNEEAEKVLRQGLDAGKAEPDRWITLVRFLTLTRQFDKAEQAVRAAEAPLAAKPLALAQCCEVVGKAIELSDPDRAKEWYGQARGWFEKAQQALKDPADLTVKRQFAKFLLDTNAAAEAEGLFKDILKQTGDGKSPALATWARRGLAQAYVGGKPPRIAEALALFAGKPGQAGDPDDARVMATIHEAQGNTEGRRQAIQDLESLVGSGSATPDDRRRLALLLESVGEWPRAREQFRALIQQTEGRDAETLARRPLYLELFIAALLRNHKPGDDSGLDEARGLVEKLKATPGNTAAPVLLEAQIDKAANKAEAATKRIRDFAARPDVSPTTRLRVADWAERLGLFDAAESVYRAAADGASSDRNGLPSKAALALFFAHRGKVKDAVDICEGLWADPKLREATANVCVAMLCGDPNAPVDEAQTRRVIGWFERAVAENPQSMTYLLSQGNLYERLGDYDRAEDRYRRVVKLDDRDGVASNNLAWLIALREGKGPEALELINNAIRAKGPVPEYLDTRGMIYLASGQGQRAVTDLEAAFRAAPTPPKYFHLAQAYLMLKDKEKARKALVAGKTRGLPGGLHRLEVASYKKVASELGVQ
jgi:tetratricopeptide (TPR) repeat protein